jgi:hypothetical protein
MVSYSGQGCSEHGNELEVHTAVFWVTSRNVVQGYQCFEGMNCLHLKTTINMETIYYISASCCIEVSLLYFKYFRQ